MHYAQVVLFLFSGAYSTIGTYVILCSSRYLDVQLRTQQKHDFQLVVVLNYALVSAKRIKVAVLN